jgi:arylsulfatase A-like enzyme
MGVGELTSQSSGTFTACMILWTGLAPDADFQTAHRAPTLWEVARAVGYHTAYIASQNLRYEDLAIFLERAGIDLELGAFDLGPLIEQQIGGPDELATARTLRYVRELPGDDPYFAVLHLCNTHQPYRVDPALQPFAPHDAKPFGDTEKLHNHYRNSALLQERTVSEFLRELRATPRWDDTVVIFLSDHGEQFREHGRLYHLNHIFDEEVRVPGFVVAGPRAVSAAQREALATFALERTYTQDVHATVLDLLGVFDVRASFPLADRAAGRSLLRPRPAEEPIALLSTQSGVWEDDDPRFGARRGPWLVVGTDTRPFQCFHTPTDRLHQRPQPIEVCPTPLVDAAKAHFPEVPPRW